VIVCDVHLLCLSMSLIWILNSQVLDKHPGFKQVFNKNENLSL